MHGVHFQYLYNTLKLLNETHSPLLLRDGRKVGFNMISFMANSDGAFVKDQLDNCGTVCCLGGWACILSGEYEVEGRMQDEAARIWLGLTPEEADTLFAPRRKERFRIPPLGDIWKRLTVEDAIKVLKDCLDSGYVPDDVWDNATNRAIAELKAEAEAEAGASTPTNPDLGAPAPNANA